MKDLQKWSNTECRNGTISEPYDLACIDNIAKWWSDTVSNFSSTTEVLKFLPKT